jgi:hypothetical protein
VVHVVHVVHAWTTRTACTRGKESKEVSGGRQVSLGEAGTSISALGPDGGWYRPSYR